jgi:hypothetical protein
MPERYRPRPSAARGHGVSQCGLSTKIIISSTFNIYVYLHSYARAKPQHLKERLTHQLLPPNAKNPE